MYGAFTVCSFLSSNKCGLYLKKLRQPEPFSQEWKYNRKLIPTLNNVHQSVHNPMRLVQQNRRNQPDSNTTHIKRVYGSWTQTWHSVKATWLAFKKTSLHLKCTSDTKFQISKIVDLSSGFSRSSFLHNRPVPFGFYRMQRN